jgi:hypothetical protein
MKLEVRQGLRPAAQPRKEEAGGRRSGPRAPAAAAHQGRALRQRALRHGGGGAFAACLPRARAAGPGEAAEGAVFLRAAGQVLRGRPHAPRGRTGRLARRARGRVHPGGDGPPDVGSDKGRRGRLRGRAGRLPAHHPGGISTAPIAPARTPCARWRSG